MKKIGCSIVGFGVIYLHNGQGFVSQVGPQVPNKLVVGYQCRYGQENLESPCESFNSNMDLVFYR